MRRRTFIDRVARLGVAAVALTAPAAIRTALAGPAVAQGLFIHDSPRPLPGLDIKDADGKPAPLPAGKTAVLNLWASWCLPCVAELPALDRLKPQADALGVAVIALSLDRMGASAARQAFGRIGITTLDIRVDDTRRAAEVLAAPVLPTTILVDREGREAARFIGPAAWDSPPALALVRALAAGKTLSPDMAPPLVKAGMAP